MMWSILIAHTLLTLLPSLSDGVVRFVGVFKNDDE
jgi:hypothetical protein